jgi:hypothetical protein
MSQFYLQRLHVNPTNQQTNKPTNQPTNQQTNQPTNHPHPQRYDQEGGAQAATVALGGAGAGGGAGRGDRRVCLKLIDDEQLGMRGTGNEYVVVSTLLVGGAYGSGWSWVGWVVRRALGFLLPLQQKSLRPADLKHAHTHARMHTANPCRSPPNTPPPQQTPPNQVPATVSYINSEKGLVYAACSRDFNGRPCQKKLANQGDGTFYCERCGGVRGQGRAWGAWGVTFVGLGGVGW